MMTLFEIMMWCLFAVLMLTAIPTFRGDRWKGKNIIKKLFSVSKDQRSSLFKDETDSRKFKEFKLENKQIKKEKEQQKEKEIKIREARRRRR